MGEKDGKSDGSTSSYGRKSTQLGESHISAESARFLVNSMRIFIGAVGFSASRGKLISPSVFTFYRQVAILSAAVQDRNEGTTDLSGDFSMWCSEKLLVEEEVERAVLGR